MDAATGTHGRPLPELTEARRKADLRWSLGLVWVLSRKNFQVRYKRASLGMLWAVIQPAFQAAFLSFVFLKLFKIDRVPHYPLYVLSGILPWAFFSSSVIAATTSVVDNAGLVRKVAIPLTIFPLSAVGGTFIAFSASIVVLVLASAATGLLSLSVLWLPLALVMLCGFIVGISLITGAFHVAFRDVRYMVESTLLVGMYASPILYDLATVPDRLQSLIRANPMTGILTLVRAAILQRPIDTTAVWTALGGIVVLLALGVLLFRRRSHEFPDLV